VLLALAALATSGLIAACGSSSSNSSNQTTSSTSAASAGSGSGSNRTALTACLRKHGITLPAGAGAPGGGPPPSAPPSGGSGAPAGGSPPSGFPGGANGAKLQAAFKACGANFPARRNGAALPRKTIQKYVTCVRQHGYQLPNPNFSGNGPVFPANIRSNTKFQAASRACQNLLSPTGAPGQTGA
jgi:hypothetical protein